jgi:hypothetical protein
MTEGVFWSLVAAALGFGLVQVSNRKANQVFYAYRTAFGLPLTLLLVLVARATHLHTPATNSDGGS